MPTPSLRPGSINYIDEVGSDFIRQSTASWSVQLDNGIISAVPTSEASPLPRQITLADLHESYNNLLGRRERGAIAEYEFLSERAEIRRVARAHGWDSRDIDRGYTLDATPGIINPVPSTYAQLRDDLRNREEHERTVQEAIRSVHTTISSRLRDTSPTMRLGHGRQVEEPAWKKFPCVLNSDYKQTGKTTKLIEEMIAIEDLDCYFITPHGQRRGISAISDVLEKKKIPYEHLNGKGAVKRKDTEKLYYVHAFSPDLVEKLRGRNDNGVPIFIDDLDQCLQAFFGRNTVVSLSWTLKQ